MSLIDKIKKSLNSTNGPKETIPDFPYMKLENIPICPYCGVLLRQRPKRKIKCEDCGNDIYYRGKQVLFPSVYVTEMQANVADEYRHFIYMAQEFGFSDNCYQETELALARKFNKQPSPSDVIWALYNQLILRIKDLGRLKGIYYSMALFLNKNGKNYNHMLELSIRMDITNWKSKGDSNFEVYSKDGCVNCAKLHGKKVIYDQAIKMELLPCTDCTTILHKGKKPFCRCSYNPILKRSS